MREIKFKVWDKTAKEMREVIGIDFQYQVIGYLFSEWYEDFASLDFSEIELMQYTGCKDENGKEVYEGDVVKATRYDGLAVTGVVGFRDCSFVISTGYQTIYTWIDYQIEVIGNVYEHPKLLKEIEND